MLAKPSKLDRAVAKYERRTQRLNAKKAAALKEGRAWAAVRRHVYERDKGCCRVCGRAVALLTLNPAALAQVHHITYRSAGGMDATSNLVTLCPFCHVAEHTHNIDITGDGDGEIVVTRRDA